MINYLAVQSELNTFRDYLRWCTSRFNEAGLFFGHGNEDAFNEASQLLLSILHLPVDTLPDVFLDARLTQDEKRALLIAIEKRIEKRIPLPYITNEAWFAGLPFFVDERVLIPRSPFAELIETQFQPWLTEPDSVTHILDMCTGSACIAIALAMAFEEASVIASDISSDALDVAIVNRQKYGLEDQLTLIESDIWQNIPQNEKFDLIISNPPYVGADEMASLPEEYRHEPTSALEADDNGLALVARILSGAAEHLTENGLIFVEVGNTDLAVDDKWPEIAFTWLELENGGHGIFTLDKTNCELFKELYG